MRSRAMPAASQAAARADEETRALRRRRRRSAAPPASSAARPACASGTRRRRSPRTASSAPGRRSASTSLTIAAPAAIAARITAGLRVSTDTATPSPASASSTGSTRSQLFALGHGRAPGRVDSPPMSMMSAPSSRIRRACASARCAVEEAAAVGKRVGRDVDDAHDAAGARGRSGARRSERPQLQRQSTGAARRRVPGESARRQAGFADGAAPAPARRPAAACRCADCVGFGGRGGRPAMMSSIWSASSVSHSSSALAIASTLSRLSSSSLRASAYCSSMIRRISRVDLLHRRFRHVLVRRDRAAEEHLALVLAVDHRAQRVGHAVARDHVARDLGGALEVVRRAGGHLVHEELFGDAPAEQHRDHVQQVVAVHAVAVLLGQLHRHAQRAAARDDRDLVHRVGLRQQLARRPRGPTRGTRCCAALPRASPSSGARRP